jgi:hypothetical protein
MDATFPEKSRHLDLHYFNELLALDGLFYTAMTLSKNFPNLHSFSHS